MVYPELGADYKRLGQGATDLSTVGLFERSQGGHNPLMDATETAAEIPNQCLFATKGDCRGVPKSQRSRDDDAAVENG